MDRLSASEAVYGFAAWLTTRKEAVVLGRKHNSALIASLVAKFCETNGLSKTREGWEKNLLHPVLRK